MVTSLRNNTKTMETKTFKIVKNMLFPIRSVIEIGSEGIANKGKFVAWENIKEFSCSITSVNRAMNYIIAYDDNYGKGYTLNFIVTIVGSKKKKAMFYEIFAMFHEGVITHHILPKSKQWFDKIEAGEEITLAGSNLSKKGIEVEIGMMRKEKVFIPYENIKIEHPNGIGGFRVVSSKNKKHFQHFLYPGTETRYLLAVLERMFPEQAQVYMG